MSVGVWSFGYVLLNARKCGKENVMVVGYNRQYVGARYVPKFFENVNGSWEWAQGFQYEPLTIVRYGDNSYTSKKMVPDTVGSPNLNPEYWANTGNYNGMIQEIQNQLVQKIYYTTPESFGAYGDGIHDDTEAVRKALNETNGIVILTGSYVISEPIDIKATKIMGGGKIINNATTRYIFYPLNDFSCESITFDSNSNLGSISLEKSSGIYFEIKSCIFKNLNGTKVAYPTQSQIYATAISVESYITIDRCIFLNNGYGQGTDGKLSRCITCDQGEAINVSNCSSNKCNQFIVVASSLKRLMIENCDIKLLEDNFVYGGGSESNLITGCYVQGGDEGIVAWRSKSFIIANCLLNTNNYALTIADNEIENILIDTCIIYRNVTKNRTGYKGGNIKFNNCKFLDFTNYAINVSCIELIIIGCEYRGIERAGIAYAADTILLADIMGSTTTGYLFVNTENVTIAGYIFGIRYTNVNVAELNEQISTTIWAEKINGGMYLVNNENFNLGNVKNAFISKPNDGLYYRDYNKNEHKIVTY